MKCPNDDTILKMSDRQGIEIDYCPQCRGVWLDRGELDKIIERSSVRSVAPLPANHDQPQPHYDQHRRDDNYRHNSDDYDHKKHRKEGFLGELFDF